MKLNDVFNNRLNESLDKPYPIHKQSNTTYDIDADGTEIRVFLNGISINGVNCLSVKFINPNNAVQAMSATNIHGNSALRVFATLATLIDPIKFNLLLCVADDDNIDVENKKNNLYMVIFKKFERLGKIHSVRKITVNEFNKPIIVAERGVALDNDDVKQIVLKFAQQHLTR